jgi:phosphatidylethanolamine/phosphatidyl-N-methylethanolamine N-methyltransferase
MDDMEIVGAAAPALDEAVASRPRWLTFFHQWWKNPLAMSSVAPSGRKLASLMVGAIPAGARRVVELGAGTGAITRALVEGLPGLDHLLVVEMNPVLHQVLLQEFPDVRVACGDARNLGQLLHRHGAFEPGQGDAVVSSLGLLPMPLPVQRAILSAAFESMHPEGVFVQYTYGLAAPVAPEITEELGLRCERLGTAWLNLPPARVFVYRRA